MKKLNETLAIVIIINFILVSVAWKVKYDKLTAVPPVVEQPQEPEPEPEPIEPGPYNVGALDTSKFLTYSEVTETLKRWNKEAPELTEFGTYGNTSRGTPCYYLRMGTPGQPKVLIHSMIHGNERLAGASTLWIMQKLLSEYAVNDEVTELLKTRDVYFVPVLSPDTYLRSRHVEGVDPNRDYPSPRRPNRESSSPIKRIMEFHEKHKFKGVISGHTTGRVYLWPSLCKGADLQAHADLAKEMGKLSNYNSRGISNINRWGKLESGYEIDWYFWKGAVAILTEFASGSHAQPTRNIEPEASRNYEAYKHFIKRSPEIKLNGN